MRTRIQNDLDGKGTEEIRVPEAKREKITQRVKMTRASLVASRVQKYDDLVKFRIPQEEMGSAEVHLRYSGGGNVTGGITEDSREREMSGIAGAAPGGRARTLLFLLRPLSSVLSEACSTCSVLALVSAPAEVVLKLVSCLSAASR